MTLRSDEIIWWNTHKDSLISIIASAIAFSSAITTISVNHQRMLYYTNNPYAMDLQVS